MTDIFGYVYTSGTTGLPKAAIMPHWRVVGYAATFVNNWRVRDRWVCTPPRSLCAQSEPDGFRPDRAPRPSSSRAWIL